MTPQLAARIPRGWQIGDRCHLSVPACGKVFHAHGAWPGGNGNAMHETEKDGAQGPARRLRFVCILAPGRALRP
ncbi:MAG: hypothetical protein Kow0045_26240 [Albidovulum sp.]